MRIRPAAVASRRKNEGIFPPCGACGVRGALLVTTAVLSLNSVCAQAEEPTTKTYQITAQPVATALKAFAAQSGMQLIFTERDVGQAKTIGVNGNLAPRDALSTLLKGTDLEFEFTANEVIVVRKAGHAVARTTGLQRVADNRLRLAQSGGDGSSAASEDELAHVEEIVVTAQKRIERLQDVPISISVLTGEGLDKFTGKGVMEALRSVPGVATTVHHQGGGTQISVRGVAANGVLFRGSSPVSYYLDAVPFGMVTNAAAPDANVYDLERVEVLRGPQGTLYGASAQNGVVRILTHDADLEELEFKARTSASGTDHGGESYRADMALNVPIVEGKLAARVVGGYEDSSGWIDKPNDKDANDGELRNMRLKLNAQPTEAFSVGLSAWASRVDYGGQAASANGRTHFSSFKEPISTDYDVLGLKMGYEFSAFSVSSVTSYLDYENHALEDLRGEGFEGEVTTNSWSKVFAQEVVVNSTHVGAWRWSAGAFYRDAKDRLRQDIVPAKPFFDGGDLSESFALFGELTRLVLEGEFELTAGLRYFEDDVTQVENLPSENLPSDGDFTRPPLRSKETFDKVSPRVVLTWHPGEYSTVYASYAEGFRSGFSQNASVKLSFPEFPPVKPDNLKNYEVGAKGSFWDGRLGYDAALYYLDWQDVQLVGSLLIDGLIVPGPINGDSASGAGLEFALRAEPAEGLELGLSFGWNDLTSDNRVLARGAVLFDEGDRLNYSPEITASASLDYRLPLGGGGFKGRFSASATYMSEQTFHNVEGGVSANYPGDALLIARTAFSIDSPEHWVTTLFVDNINNETGPLVRGPFGEPDNAPRARPRTMGVQVEYQF